MATPVTAAQQQQAAMLAQQQQQLAMQRQLAQGGQAGLQSPYDGSTPYGTPMPAAIGGYPLEAGVRPASLAGLDGGRPQVNATNQSALAPNGDVNQQVTNENRYENKYYNIVTMPQGYGVGGGVWGGVGVGVGGLGYGSPYGSNCFVDPMSGVMYCQRETGFFGWLKSLFRGY